MENQEEPPDLANATRINYIRVILTDIFPDSSNLVMSLDLGGVNGHSLCSRVTGHTPTDASHFSIFYTVALRHAARHVSKYDSELLSCLFETSAADFLSGKDFTNSLKLFYAAKYPEKVEMREKF